MIDVVGMYHMNVLYDKTQNVTKDACKFPVCVCIVTCLVYKLDQNHSAGLVVAVKIRHVAKM